jgi:flagellar motor switch protein FliN
MVEPLFDLELPVTVALGHADLLLKDVLRMKSGSVIELEKEVSEDVELLAHGTLVARGEMVLVNENYAFRVKEIVSRAVTPPLLGSSNGATE